MIIEKLAGASGEAAARVSVEGRGHTVTYRSSALDSALDTGRAEDAFLALALEPAMEEGRSLTIRGAVSPKLLVATNEAQGLLFDFDRTAWHAGLRRVAVDARYRHWSTGAAGGVGCFFSGGVDSFFSVLTHRHEITHLVFVHGFDVRLDDSELRDRVAHEVRGAAADLGKPLIEVETDLRETFDPLSDWERYHGGALASVALLLRGVLGRMYVPASDPLAVMVPWGSHPLLDPLWGSEDLTIVNDGGEADRGQKVASFRDEPVPLQRLRVCWENAEGAYNCGRCTKCVRTMVDLRMAGLLEQCATFPDVVDPSQVAQATLSLQFRILWHRYLAQLERTGEDPDLGRAIRYAVRPRRQRRLRAEARARDRIQMIAQRLRPARSGEPHRPAT